MFRLEPHNLFFEYPKLVPISVFPNGVLAKMVLLTCPPSVRRIKEVWAQPEFVNYLMYSCNSLPKADK